MAEFPLGGRVIAVTRAAHQAEALLGHLRALGATALPCPSIQIVPPPDTAPLDAALRRLEEYDWLIVTSANGARALAERLEALRIAPPAPRRPRVGAIGPATAAALTKSGMAVDFLPREYVAEAILEEIGPIRGARVLLPRADIARETLAAGLRERGARVDEIAAYRTIPGPGGAMLAARLVTDGVDAVTFTSSSTVRYLLEGLRAAGLDGQSAVERLNRARVVCIGPITAATARQEGLRVDEVADEYTAEGLVRALVRVFGQPRAAR